MLDVGHFIVFPEKCTLRMNPLCEISRGSNGYARIDVRFPDKNDKLVQTR